MKARTLLIHAFVILAILFIGLAPIFVSLVAGAVASANGCRLDESAAHLCLINGKDYGDTLYAYGVAGWFSLATLPIAALLFGVYIVVVLVLWVRKRRQAQTA